MAKQPRTLAGRVVAITGGARGIGRATAVALVRKGRRSRSATSTSTWPSGPRRSSARARPRSRSTSPTGRRSARSSPRVEGRFGALDALVNNAGIMPLGPFVEEDDVTARRLIDINVHGVMLGMKLALPRFVARGQGHLINIASAAGKGPYPGGATYCGTKHFVVGVTETVRGELRGTGVDLSVVMPVVVDTELASGVGTAAESRVRPEDVARRSSRRCAGRASTSTCRRRSGRSRALVTVLPRPVREFADAGHRSGPRAVGRPRPAAGYEARAARAEPARPARRRPRTELSSPPAAGLRDRSASLNGPLGVRRQVRAERHPKLLHPVPGSGTVASRWTHAMDCSHAPRCA